MTTTDNIDQRRRPWARWAAALVVLVAVAGAVGLRIFDAGDSAGSAAADERSLPEQLADRVVEVLEQTSAAAHAHHDHADDEEVGVVCAAEPFGFTPADATTLAEVEVVYAHHMCAEVGPGNGWPDAIRAGGPLVLELTTIPATATLPEQALPDQPDALHEDRVRALFPEEYRAEALADGGFHPRVAEVLRERFEAAMFRR